MTYTAYKGLPFSYYARKAQYYDIDASEVPTQNTTYTPTFDAYSGLNLEYVKNGASVPLIYVRGENLPDHQPHEDFVACLAQSGSTYLTTIQKYNNYLIFGSPYIEENLGVFNTQSAGYIMQSISNVGSVWDICLKITTPDTAGGQQILTVGTQNSEYKNVLIFVNNDGTGIYAKTSNDGSTNVLTGTGYTITPNTTYWLKIGCDGTNTYFKISTDEFTTETTVETVATATTIPDTNLYIGYGVNYTSKGYFKGIVDLTQTYLNVNNSTVWKPLNTSTATILHSCNFTTTGFPIINSSGIGSDFSSSNYLILPNVIDSYTSLELSFTVTTPASWGTSDYPIISFGNQKDLFLRGSTNKFALWDGSHRPESTNTVAAETTYLLKLIYDGQFKLYVNGELEITTNYNIITNGQIFIGRHSNQGWCGTMDISDCFIKVDNEYWWQPFFTASEYSMEYFKGILVGTDDGSAKTYNLFYNKGTYLLDTVSTKTGYSWAGSVYVPAHTVE